MLTRNQQERYLALNTVTQISDYTKQLTPYQPDTTGQVSPVFEMSEGNDLFCTPAGREYASILVGDHKETWAMDSRGFLEWLSRHFYESEGKAPTTQKLNEALRTLKGMAKFEGDTRDVHIRVAEDALTGNIYIDLADKDWRVIEVTQEGWSVIAGSDAPVHFERRRGMLALPEPQRGGTVAELRPFVNLGGEQDWVLLLAWLVAALRPRGAYPILALHGEQGSAKSTTARLLGSLVDPNEAPLRSEPRNERDLMIAATNKWLLTFDNLSHIPASLSDSLCRLSTGGGFATRELFTDREEAIFNAQRPIILNGIEEVATRNDLLDRSLVLYLPSIPEERRRSDVEMRNEFEQARPRILGALLDALSIALRNVEAVKLDKLPRLADFARWATAAEEGLGLTAGAFMAAYTNNRAEANELVLDTSSIGSAVLILMERHEELSLSAGELLQVLNKVAGNDTRKLRDWPRTAKGMSDALRRITTTLRAAGVRVEFGRRAGGTGKRLIQMEQVR